MIFPMHILYANLMMRALELQQLAKGTSWDEATLNSEEIKPNEYTAHLCSI